MKNFFFILLILSVVTLSKVEILDDAVASGKEVELFAQVSNPDTKNAHDSRIDIMVMETGEKVSGPRFDLDDHHGRLSYLTFDQPGEYLIRVSASNDDFSTRTFRWVVVG